MRAIQKQGLGRAVLVDLSDPVAGPGEVLVRARYAGLCASDLHKLYRSSGEKDDANGKLVMGHECSGVIEALGAGVERYPFTDRPIRVGDRVAVDPLIPCLSCESCARGQYMICPKLSHLGLWRDGCFADKFTAPATRLYPLPDEVGDLEGAMAEPLACALNFVDKAALKCGDTVTIIGGGAIGQFVALTLLHASPAAEIIVSEPVPAKREKLRAMGIRHTVSPIERSVGDYVRELTEGRGSDVVIECVGTAGAIQDALSATRSQGRCVLGGLPEGKLPLDLHHLVFGELEVRGVLATDWHFSRAIRLIASGRLPVSRLVDRIISLEEVPEAMRQAHEGKDIGKVAIRIDDSGR
ncbi:zinc-dependent alcohol dehydrogenase [Paenibacillus koleovorans]|uniref:zinc-dependent alcohol dehydrogenase n=1 Tax=Paenibacillus koleovorans TaxID=121608 RepID=UPI000FD74D99|nr:alcohol dehydrogenase catalytic domain-containing protein [Paenibacillus koleovorans]